MAGLAAASAVACLAAVPDPSALAARSATSSAGTKPAQAASASNVGGPLMASQGIVVNYPGQSSPQLPNIPASAYVIANANTGQVLAADDPHGKFGPASTMKVLTAITLIPRLNPNAMVTASQQAADTEPNDAGLIAGRKYKVSDLFTALLTISANDAAVALTQATGSFAKGMALINAEAHHLQAYDVVAKQPNGLPAAGQVESAYDEALIARQALAIPAFMKYDETLSAPFEIKPGDVETLNNQNWLLTKYPGGIGGKIGWTISSEATYIGLARRHGVTLIVTIMHCTALQEITSAVQLLNWGFAMNGKVKPVGVLVPPLATVTAAHRHKATRPLEASLAAQTSGAGDQSVYAIVAGIAVAAGLAAGALVLGRRKLTTARNRKLTGRAAPINSRPGGSARARSLPPGPCGLARRLARAGPGRRGLGLVLA
jgi:serine-type D-Ala-D-Ala carboxypeptidase (penicillin-binding protein 5/6)